jgi:hypothetical protein
MAPRAGVVARRADKPKGGGPLTCQLGSVHGAPRRQRGYLEEKGISLHLIEEWTGMDKQNILLSGGLRGDKFKIPFQFIAYHRYPFRHLNRGSGIILLIQRVIHHLELLHSHPRNTKSIMCSSEVLLCLSQIGDFDNKSDPKRRAVSSDPVNVWMEMIF